MPEATQVHRGCALNASLSSHCSTQLVHALAEKILLHIEKRKRIVTKGRPLMRWDPCQQSSSTAHTSPSAVTFCPASSTLRHAVRLVSLKYSICICHRHGHAASRTARTTVLTMLHGNVRACAHSQGQHSWACHLYTVQCLCSLMSLGLHSRPVCVSPQRASCHNHCVQFQTDAYSYYAYYCIA
jgi:hypothetical protein